MTEQTITVVAYFGKMKEVTREQFIKRWVDQAKQFHSLMVYERVKELEIEVGIAAGKAFDLEYQRQTAASVSLVQ